MSPCSDGCIPTPYNQISSISHLSNAQTRLPRLLANCVSTSKPCGNKLKGLEGLFPESQGQNLALTVSHVPYSLESGCRSLSCGLLLQRAVHPPPEANAPARPRPPPQKSLFTALAPLLKPHSLQHSRPQSLSTRTLGLYRRRNARQPICFISALIKFICDIIRSLPFLFEFTYRDIFHPCLCILPLKPEPEPFNPGPQPPTPKLAISTATSPTRGHAWPSA